MATAILVADRVPGYAGLARLYRVDPVLVYDGNEFDHVLVWVQVPEPHMDARVSVLMATSRGAPAEGSMRERPGTYVAHGNPLNDPAAVQGAFVWALAGAGQALPYGMSSAEGYVITDPAAA